jgi:hypothetical protein
MFPDVLVPLSSSSSSFTSYRVQIRKFVPVNIEKVCQKKEVYFVHFRLRYPLNSGLRVCVCVCVCVGGGGRDILRALGRRIIFCLSQKSKHDLSVFLPVA